jgi:hypothetical protein
MADRHNKGLVTAPLGVPERSAWAIRSNATLLAQLVRHIDQVTSNRSRSLAPARDRLYRERKSA